MNDTCSICLSIISRDDYCITNCNHIYCYHCLNEWLDKKNISCPNCRRDIRSFNHNDKQTKIIYINKQIQQPVIQRNNNLNTILVDKTIYSLLKFGSILTGLFFSLNIYLLTK